MKICRSTLILVVVVMVSLAFASRQSELRRRFDKVLIPKKHYEICNTQIFKS